MTTINNPSCHISVLKASSFSSINYKLCIKLFAETIAQGSISVLFPVIISNAYDHYTLITGKLIVCVVVCESSVLWFTLIFEHTIA